MINYVYETHTAKNLLLPFRFRLGDTVTCEDNPINWHNDIELLQCIEGEGYIKCGLEAYEFSQGDIFVVNADTPHSVCSKTVVRYHCLIVFNSFCEENGIPISALHFQKRIRDDALSSQLDSVVAAYTRYDSHEICSAADIRYAVLGVLRRLCSDYLDTGTQERLAPSCTYVKTALDYIRTHISERLSLEMIAAHVGISKYHLSRVFKAFTGTTVIDTINYIRCSEAKRMIEGGMRVSAAATLCGFENLSYFSRTFRKFFHALPRDFHPPRKVTAGINQL